MSAESACCVYLVAETREKNFAFTKGNFFPVRSKVSDSPLSRAPIQAASRTFAHPGAQIHRVLRVSGLTCCERIGELLGVV